MVCQSHSCIHHKIILIFLLDLIIFKTHADVKSWAQPEPYAAYVIVLIINSTATIELKLLAGRRVRQLEMKPRLPKICVAFLSNIFTRATIRTCFTSYWLALFAKLSPAESVSMPCLI